MFVNPAKWSLSIKLWYQGLVWWRAVFPWPGVAWFGMLPGSHACMDGALLACMAEFLAGHEPVPVHGLGIGDPWIDPQSSKLRNSNHCLRDQTDETKRWKFTGTQRVKR